MPLLQSVNHLSEQHPPPELIPRYMNVCLTNQKEPFCWTSAAEDSWTYASSKEKAKQLSQAQ